MEIVIGLVSALGTDLDRVCTNLDAELSSLGPSPKLIRLSSELHNLELCAQLSMTPVEDYYRSHIAAGDELCARTKMRHAMASLGVLAITQERKNIVGPDSQELPDAAYIVRSLKRPEEVELLRSVYRDRFVVMAAYAPRANRVDTLAERIAASLHQPNPAEFRAQAEALISMDESESASGIEAGQNVRDTFPLADLFIDASNQDTSSRSIKRAVELIFGHPFHTPTIDEYGMFLAFGASRRSADLNRQVGAAIVDTRGKVVSLGCNEVPRAGGGSYWPEDENDARDFKLGYDTSYRRRRQMLADVLRRLQGASWLSDEKKDVSVDDLVDLALSDRDTNLRDAQLMDVIEFGRAVHAEMLAITEAADRGVPVSGTTLYSTTFPCHNCARHIVSAGIARVVYVEPYPKSLAADMFKDSIVLDPGFASDGRVRFEPFVGVGPRLYLEAFSQSARRDANGNASTWIAAGAEPKVVWSSPTYPTAEDMTVTNFDQALTEAGIKETEEGDS